MKELLKDPKERDLHAKLLKKDVATLYRKATELITRVELGEFNEEQMVEAEYRITHLLAAIEDLEKVLDLELTPTPEDENDLSLSR